MTNIKEDTARGQAIAQANSIISMVAALKVDYDRLDELKEQAKAGHWVAGWHIPGTGDDEHAVAFNTCDEARSYIKDHMRYHADARVATGDSPSNDEQSLLEVADLVGSMVGEDSAGYGKTVAGLHYWITHIYTGLADPDEAEELEELEADAGDCSDKDEAIQRIQVAALSVEVRSGWRMLGVTYVNNHDDEEFRIVLCTGGPHVEIRGELCDGEPVRAWIEYWGDESGELHGHIEQATLLTYCQQFFG